MLTYILNPNSDQPLYEQLYYAIKKDILSSVLKAGEKLPSRRSIASQLSISVITVMNAYDQLMLEGYIYSKPRSGYFVSDLSVIMPLPESGKNKIESKTPEDAKIKAGTLKEEKAACRIPQDRNGMINLSSNQTDPGSFPFTLWSRITRKVLREKQEILMTNPPFFGLFSLREAIAHYLSDFTGINTSPDQIVIGAGSEYLLGMLIQFFGRDHIIAGEDPGYGKLSGIADIYGISCAHIPLDGSGIRMDLLNDSGADIVHVTSHHFPTGITMPVKRRLELLDWARHDRFIIEDNYDSEFRMTGHPISSLYTMDSERVIYMNTFTRALSSTIRISYMVLPEKIAIAFNSKLGFYSSPVPAFEQESLAEFISEGHFERHINRMRNTYRKKRDHILKALREIQERYEPASGQKIIGIHEENSGLHFILSVNNGDSAEEIKRKALEQGLLVKSLSDYYYKKPENESCDFVISYSSLSDSEITEAVERLARALGLSKIL